MNCTYCDILADFPDVEKMGFDADPEDALEDVIIKVVDWREKFEAALKARLEQIKLNKKLYSPMEPIWSKLEGEREAITAILGGAEPPGEAKG